MKLTLLLNIYKRTYAHLASFSFLKNQQAVSLGLMFLQLKARQVQN